MAKGKTFEEAIDEVLGDYTNVIQKATKYAALMTQKDIFNYSQTCLEQYYKNYDPTSYERTNSLKNAILPYKPRFKNTDKYCGCRIGMQYVSDKLDGVYNGSRYYSPVDGEYVLLNYLYGIHPGTNGSPVPLFVEYYEIDDTLKDDNPWNKMEKYLTTTVPERYRQRLLLYMMKKAT